MSILSASIESSLKFNINRNFSFSPPDNTFGIFVSIERSIYHKLEKWPEDVHGCIGYWKNDHSLMEKKEIMENILDKSYASTWQDSRRSYFEHSLYVDIFSKNKIYFMRLPIYKINYNSGNIDELSENFNNKKYGLIVESKTNLGANSRATYLPEVFDENTGWKEIRNRLESKAGATTTNDNNVFYAYKCEIIEMRIIDYYFQPIVNFLNEHYGDFIPYEIYDGKIIRNKNNFVRNIATIYDFLKLGSRKYYGNISPKIKEQMINNIDYYAESLKLNSKNRQSLAFLLVALKLIDDEFPTKKYTKYAQHIRQIYNYLLEEIENNFDSIEKQFELFEILMALAIIEKKDKKRIEKYWKKFRDYDEESESGSSNIFRYNWISKFILEYLKNNKVYRKDKENINYYLDKIIKYIEEYIIPNKEIETNYLAVAFEGLTSLYMFDKNREHEKYIEYLIIELNNRKNKYGLYIFKNGNARLDITGHVLNGYFNLVDSNFCKIISEEEMLECSK